MNQHEFVPNPGQRQHPAVVALLAKGKPSAVQIAAFAASHAFPLTEPGWATFAWVGDADEVDLVRWIAGSGDREPFTPVPGTGLWLLRLPVEDNGRFEYKLSARKGDVEKMFVDPLNPARAQDPFGENSVCRTFGYVRPDWSLPKGAPAGRVETLPIASAAFGETRHEQVYVPAGVETGKPLPLVVIHDGIDYMTFADLGVSLDNLIDAGDIPPLVAALVQTRDRLGEYTGGRRHSRYVVKELLPAISNEYSISTRAEDRVLLGASLGAVASLATAFRYPGCFGGLVLKSGSFIFDDRKLESRPHPVFHTVAQLVRALQRAPALPRTRAFISTGELEGLADQNQALATFLRERGVEVLFRSAWDGHHWHNWRDQLREGLRWVLGSGDHCDQG